MMIAGVEGNLGNGRILRKSQKKNLNLVHHIYYFVGKALGFRLRTAVVVLTVLVMTSMIISRNPILCN